MATRAYDHDHLVGGSSSKTPSDELEQRQAIRLMCAYIADDAKIARYHAVSIDKVRLIRAGIKQAKRKGQGERCYGDKVRGTAASGVDYGWSPADTRAKDSIKRGSEALLAAILREHPWARAA